MRDYYVENIFPLITPLAMDPAHPFPFISNLSLNLLVTVRERGADTRRWSASKYRSEGRCQDSSAWRAIRCSCRSKTSWQTISTCCSRRPIESCELFRVTRNAIVERGEGKANDLLELIESELRDRKFAPSCVWRSRPAWPPCTAACSPPRLGLNEEADVFEVDGLMAKRDLFQIASIDRPELRDPRITPLTTRASRGAQHLSRDPRHGPILLQHPYESFVTSVERFLKRHGATPRCSR